MCDVGSKPGFVFVLGGATRRHLEIAATGGLFLFFFENGFLSVWPPELST